MEPINTTNERVIPPPPIIPESEMKLPEEPVSGVSNAPLPSQNWFNPLLIGLLVLLLAVLAVVIIWGETLIGLVLPDQSIPDAMTPEQQQALNERNEIQGSVAELDSLDLESSVAHMNTIDAQIRAELTASSTTSTTTATTTP